MGLIYVSSFGDVESRLLLASARNIKEVFRLQVRISSVALPPKLGYDPVRKQHDINVLLEYLSGVSFPDMVRVVALAGFDLCGDGLDFVFGKASPRGVSVIVNTYRLRHPNEKVTFERVVKEVNYLLGLSFGLKDCEDAKCAMNSSYSLKDIDRKGRLFCKTCSEKLSSILSGYTGQENIGT